MRRKRGLVGGLNSYGGMGAMGCCTRRYTVLVVTHSTPTHGATGAVNTSTGTSITPALPTGVVANSILLGFLECPLSAAPAAPSGWTRKAKDDLNGSGLYWRRADGATDTAPAFTGLTPGTASKAVVVRIEGCVATGDPFDAISTAANVLGASQAGTAITTTIDNTFVGFAVSNYDDDQDTFGASSVTIGNATGPATTQVFKSNGACVGVEFAPGIALWRGAAATAATTAAASVTTSFSSYGGRGTGYLFALAGIAS